MLPQLLTIEQVCDYLKIKTKSKLKTMALNGEISFVNIAGKMHFTHDQVSEYLTQNTIKKRDKLNY